MGMMLPGNWVSGSISEHIWPSPVALVLLALDAWLGYRYGRAQHCRGTPAEPGS